MASPQTPSGIGFCEVANHHLFLRVRDAQTAFATLRGAATMCPRAYSHERDAQSWKPRRNLRLRLPLVYRPVSGREKRPTLYYVINFLLAMLAGAALPVQIGVNSTLRATVGHPLWVTIISFVVGALTVALLLLLLGVPAPVELPPVGWQWLGGSLGVIYVCLSLLLAPRLGAASLVATVVAGQLAASLVLDHFGWLGFPQHLVTAPRLLGALLLGAGVWLIGRS